MAWTRTLFGVAGTTVSSVFPDTFVGELQIKGPRPWVDVRAYGAKGDGTTDDTTAVQNALNAGTGLVIFPPGTYLVAGALTIRTIDSAGIHLLGAGRDHTVIKQSSDTNTFVSAVAGTTQQFITIEDMTIDSSLALGSRTTGAAIRITGAGKFGATISRVQAKAHFNGVYLTDMTLASLRDVQATGHKQDGFLVDGSAPTTTLNMYGCYAASNTRYGFNFDSIIQGNFTDLVSEGNTDHQFRVSGAGELTFIGAYTELTATAKAAMHLDSVSRVTLITPRFDNSGNNAISTAATAQQAAAITILGGSLGNRASGGYVIDANNATYPFTLIGVRLSPGAGASGAINDPNGAVIVMADHSVTIAESWRIGNGTKITKHLSATAALNFDLSASASQDLTITVTGAAVGDTVAIGVPNGSVTADTLFWGWVSATNTVTIRAMRIAGTPDPASGTFRVDVWQH